MTRAEICPVGILLLCVGQYGGRIVETVRVATLLHCTDASATSQMIAAVDDSKVYEHCSIDRCPNYDLQDRLHEAPKRREGPYKKAAGAHLQKDGPQVEETECTCTNGDDDVSYNCE